MQPSQENNRLPKAIYLGLMQSISEMQSRLLWSELVFFTLDLVVFIFISHSLLTHFQQGRPTPLGLMLMYFSIASGMAVSTYWIAYSMRLQMRLKLRYFQARQLERLMGMAGGGIFTDEQSFNKDERVLESLDKAETIRYPASLDGFIGGAKQRQLTWFVPGIFFSIYSILFLWMLAGYSLLV